MGNDYLKKLAELTEKLPDLVKTNSSPGFIEYKMEQGTCLGYNLLNQKEIAVQKAFLSKGAVFPKHSHEEKEILIVFQGELLVKIEESSHNISPSELIELLPHQIHSVTALSDTWVLCIAIPAAQGYPE